MVSWVRKYPEDQSYDALRVGPPINMILHSKWFIMTHEPHVATNERVVPQKFNLYEFEGLSRACVKK